MTVEHARPSVHSFVVSSSETPYPSVYYVARPFAEYIERVVDRPSTLPSGRPMGGAMDTDLPVVLEEGRAISLADATDRRIELSLDRTMGADALGRPPVEGGSTMVVAG